ncbi:MAG: DUF6089 family protein [Bacteroidales bacterium]|nr:DUF6089 family protein [Bacteroidales bacterium]
MKNKEKHFALALVVLLIGVFLPSKMLCGQVIEVGPSVGLSYYMGDINPKMPLRQSSLGLGAVVRYYGGTRWAFRLSYSYLNLHGDDAVSNFMPERGLAFKTTAHDVSIVAEFNFFDYFTGSKRNYISPYIFGGISGFYFNPKALDGTPLSNIPTDVEDYGSVSNGPKYSNWSASVPFGVGVKYSAGKKVGLALEWRMHLTFTDWIDDCHAYYPEKIDSPYIDPGNLAGNGMQYIQRGNRHDTDWFGYLNFSIVYKFVLPGNDDCNPGSDKKYSKNY